MVKLQLSNVLNSAGIVQVPQVDESWEIMAQKMQVLTKATGSGHDSIAMNTGFVLAKSMMDSIMDDLEVHLDGLEKLILQLWRSEDGTEVSDFDFNNTIENITPDQYDNYTKMARAMNRLWNVNEATMENAAYLEYHYPHEENLIHVLVQLDEAVDERLKAHHWHDEEIQVADVETISGIIRTVDNAFKKYAYSDLDAHAEECDEIKKAVEVLKVEKENLESNIASRTQKT